tara:strand:- start:850 stop:1380 length:531 start_codon:yes stop_codon:yes gene_type:complete
MKAKRLEVKNVKHSDFASHETLCFECSVYFDGIKVATAENDGRGGETFVSFTDRETEKKVRAWEKEQPKIVSEYKSNKDDDEFFSYPFSLESAIDPLVGDFLTERDLKRKLKTKLLITDDTCDSGQFYTWTLKKFGQLSIKDIANAVLSRNKFENPVVLNMLPFEEALKKWGNNDA